ncbi:ABC transporter ATP-binding protein [Nakamurella sp.]|uniref:ABC transporter ATP-binding protein n=1 Tax=Nakamurella sp. TaxID=1869182 RepID=UPI003B3B63D2
MTEPRSADPAGTALLRADRVVYRYPRRRGATVAPPAVLDSVDLAVRPGEFVAVLGMNGCGKSTLLRLLAGELTPDTGRIRVRLDDGAAPAELSGLSRRAIARRIAVVHQSLPPLPGLSVAAFVRQGRYPHEGALGALRRPAGAPGAEVERALNAVGLTGAAHRLLDELSGGERQRARLALALAQAAPVLLLDEPIAHLDVRHQLQMLALVDELRRTLGLTVVAVLHELDVAARAATRLVALARGRVVADGAPADVLDAELLRTVYQVRGRVVPDALTGRPRCLVDEPVAEDGARDGHPTRFGHAGSPNVVLRRPSHTPPSPGSRVAHSEPPSG